MISPDEIVSSLKPLNGVYFTIDNLREYADKVVAHGKNVSLRHGQSKELMSYVLYQDNGPEIFITMVWTHPRYRGRGLAKRLLRGIIASSSKDIKLKVHRDNPAMRLYEGTGFIKQGEAGGVCAMRRRKKISIMQPYLFPYIGYFHLIEASDRMVFYDDVNYIPRGWVNRNRILIDGEGALFTVPVSKSSQNTPINQTAALVGRRWEKKFRSKLLHAYRKAPHFSAAEEVVMSVFSSKKSGIGDLAIRSVCSIYKYLGVRFDFTKSSACSPGTKGMGRADRLIEISKAQGFKAYINAPGGRSLYRRSYFSSRGVELMFVDSEPVEYKQYANGFVPALSIIDVLMFNDIKAVKALFTKYNVG